MFRFGFDGGRHGLILQQAHRAGLRNRDWLLLEAILSKASMRIKVDSASGNLGGFLDILRVHDGGLP